MCCEQCCSKFERLSEEQKEALRELGRHSWTACCVLGGDTDWTTADQIDHMKTCPLTERYRELWKAAASVKALFKKELK